MQELLRVVDSFLARRAAHLAFCVRMQVMVSFTDSHDTALGSPTSASALSCSPTQAVSHWHLQRNPRAAHLAFREGAQRVAVGHAGGPGRQRGGAVLVQQVERSVGQVAHRVGHGRVDDVAEALLREVAVLPAQAAMR